MLESVLSRAAKAVKFLLALLDHHHLGLEILPCLLVLVAHLGVLALLLVELCLTLLHLGLLALYARHALVCLLLGLRFDFQFLLARFKKLVFHDYLRLAVGVVNDCFCSRTGGGSLHGYQDCDTDGRSDERRADVE